MNKVDEILTNPPTELVRIIVMSFLCLLMNDVMVQLQKFDRLVPHAMHGHDKDGSPVYYERLVTI